MSPRNDDPTEIEPRPTAPPPPGARSNPDALRADIDSGATGDKVPMTDPATAPLGADAEASGVPTPPEAVAEVRRIERETAPRRSPLDPTDRRNEDRSGWRLVGILVALVLLGIGAAWVGLS